MSDQSSERITSNIESTKAIQPGQQQESEPGESFKSYMEGGQQPGQAAGGKSEGITPFDLAGQGGMTASAAPSMDSLVGQMNSASSVLGDLQSQLHTKNLNLKQSQKYLLRNKLTSANQDIRSAADKAGVDVGEPPPTSARQSPVTKFLDLSQMGKISSTKLKK